MSSSAETNGIVLYTSGVAASVAVEKNTERVEFLLTAMKAPFKSIDISISTADKDYMHSHSTNPLGKNQLPQVFVNGEYCGNKDEIEESNECGELKQLLKLA